MKIIEWAKAHPWTTGALVVGGGLTFFLLSGWFTGGSSSGGLTVNQAGKTDAEIAADAAIAAAQIGAQAQASQSGASLEAARIMAQIEAQRIGYDYQLGMHELDVGQSISLASLDANVANSYLQAQTILGLGGQQTQALIAQITSTTKGKKQKYIGQNIGAVYTSLGPLSGIYSGVSGSATSNTVSNATPAPVTTSSVGSGSSTSTVQV